LFILEPSLALTVQLRLGIYYAICRIATLKLLKLLDDPVSGENAWQVSPRTIDQKLMRTASIDGDQQRSFDSTCRKLRRFLIRTRDKASNTFMRSGTTRAKATFCCFHPTPGETVGVEDQSAVENASAGCSNTTAVPHEYFCLTGSAVFIAI